MLLSSCTLSLSFQPAWKKCEHRQKVQLISVLYLLYGINDPLEKQSINILLTYCWKASHNILTTAFYNNIRRITLLLYFWQRSKQHCLKWRTGREASVSIASCMSKAHQESHVSSPQVVDRPELYVSQWMVFDEHPFSFKLLNVKRKVSFLNFITATRKICRVLNKDPFLHVHLYQECTTAKHPHCHRSSRLWFCYLVPCTLWRTTEILNVNVTSTKT